MKSIPIIVIAFLNGVWQSGIVAALVWVTLRFARRINAATRHVIWWTVLVVTLLLPAAPRMAERWHGQAATAPVIARNSSGFRYVKAPVLIEPGTVVTLRYEPSAKWPLLILAAWAALFLYRLGQTGTSYLHLRGVKRRARLSTWPLPAVSRSLRLLLSDEIESPMALGFLRPAIILPASLSEKLDWPELNHVLLHEAAHIARWDDWTNLTARLLGAVLALHPVALWILRRIGCEREVACDDWVVARTGAARPYAESLAHICELHWSARRELLAQGVLGGGSRISDRIERLLRRGREFSPRASCARVAASAALLLTLLAAASLAPRYIGFAQRLEFEVASVKLNTINGPMDPVPRRSGDRVTIHNNTLGNVILYAYHVNFYQVVGNLQLPDGWNWYDIEAKAPGAPSDDQIRLMLQALLEDRFKLKVHRETREMAVYKLVIAKNGPKIKPAVEGSKMTIDGKPIRKGFAGVAKGMDGPHLMGKDATMTQLVNALSGALAGPVADDTGLQGTYDFDVLFARDAPQLNDDSSAPLLPSALQSELGLKLERSKGPVEVLVIDHLEKPSEN